MFSPRIAGMSQNANAFSFMLLLHRQASWPAAGREALLGILLLGIWYTRAAFVSLPVVFGAAFYMRALSFAG